MVVVVPLDVSDAMSDADSYGDHAAAARNNAAEARYNGAAAMQQQQEIVQQQPLRRHRSLLAQEMQPSLRRSGSLHFLRKERSIQSSK
jgi:hypothetical protein